MNSFFRRWSLTLASTVAAALLAACGGGSEPPTGASTAQVAQPMMAVLQSAAPAAGAAAVDVDVTSTPVDSDRVNRSGTPASNNAYIVQLDEMPVTAYDGRIKGLGATKPKKGQKINPNSPAVVNYMAYLAARHDSVIKGVGNARKLYSYGYVFNGFAAELTEAQAQKVAQTKGVLVVAKDELRSVDTSSTPGFLGLSGSSGFWSTTGAKGEGVIIGMVDSGIWPESDSFTDRTGTNGNASKDGKLDYQQIPGWHGKCTPGDQFTGTDCNQKLIGARYYNAGWGGNAGISAQLPWEFNSPRDYEGHGTHTASTAGGNSGVVVTGPAAVFGTVSGMAPRARIAVYKVCWASATGGCFSSDSVAAIDQAVADGVDVINFSISGSTTNFRDPVEIAFLFAADAGVFVAASAGNSGPATSTVAHPGPWLTTVAAGTHNRSALGSVTLGNGVTYSGASLAAASVGPATLIDSSVASVLGANATAARLCFSTAQNGGVPVLDPAKVTGKIVVCDRGTNARTDKSLAVKEAGGIGMVLVNVTTNSLNADFHSVPTVHLQATARTAVKAYAATADAKATINPSTFDYSAAAPFTAGFSSRGPLIAGDGNLLKPDLIAPGQDILAAVAPPGNGGRSFDIYSGTSMSSPHVAGIAALFKQLYPSWSPMAIKSALMTTGTDVLDGPNTNPLVIFRQGAGHVKPIAATNPGLVFDSGYADWLGFLCGTQLPASFCTSSGIPVLNPSDLNVASIALGALPGVQTVKRRVTNVGGSAAVYTPSVSGLGGLTVAFSPATLSIGAGETKEFNVTFTRTTAAIGTYAGGQLTLNDGSHKVRVPIVVRPVAMAAPAEVTGSYSVTFGYDGPFSATARGLVPAVKSPGSVATGDSVDIAVVVPSGMTHARFSLFDSDVSQSSDLDLEVYLNGTLVGSSGGATAAEEVNLRNPLPGTYTVHVLGFAVPSGSASFNLYSWALGSTAAGNMTVTAPATAVTGQTGAITIATSGLTAATKYLGSVVYGGAPNLPNPTIVRVNP
ncbi:MAG: S8 family peptidase [Ramlibacter sp.]|nr:S8 family peptidase [Ramlibacter sp.]